MVTIKSLLLAAGAAASGGAAVAAATADPVPRIPIFDAAPHTTVLNRTDHGELQLVSVPSADGGADLQTLRVMHLYGSPTQMGHAHGLLMGQFAADFLNVKMPQFFESELEQVPMAGLPDWLVELFDKAVVPAAPEIFNIALEWVFNTQKDFLDASPTHVLDELGGMAQGLCESGAILDRKSDGTCDVNKLTGKLVRFNLLPELIRMSCSIVGATNKATPSGGLNQLRALDFGGGPFANYSVLTVYHPDEGNAFASVGFAGFANLVTGIGEYIGVSEKVHEVYDNGTGLQPGTYKGRAVATVMREMLQFTNSTQQAIEYARNANRTWSVFLGTGDTGNNFDVLQYKEKDVEVFGWQNISNVTDSTPIEDVTYVDRHPQPTHDPDMMPTILKSNYGNLSIETFAQLPQQLGPTGDVHIAVYDYPNQKMLVSVGTVDVNGTYGPNDQGMAAHRPFLRFDLKDLWAHTQPSAPAVPGVLTAMGMPRRQ